jgi:hypothetical protein
MCHNAPVGKDSPVVGPLFSSAVDLKSNDPGRNFKVDCRATPKEQCRDFL